MAILGIDASSITTGGGRTHLIEILSHVKPHENNFDKVILWGNERIIRSLENIKQPWLTNLSNTYLKNIFSRTLWQIFILPNEAKRLKVDIMLVPGGNICFFNPYVSMSRNMLPFETTELLRFGISKTTIRYILLRLTQTFSFRRAKGVIFLNEYAKKIISEKIGKKDNLCKIIPHGINKKFFNENKQNFDKKIFELVYVSTINMYKHQWNVIDAVNNLRKVGFNISLKIIGDFYKPAFLKLKKKCDEIDDIDVWCEILGPKPYSEISKYYKNASIGIFASTCENLPNILLEMMASSLPIACSNRGPMPSILGENGIYFDPENINSIISALRYFLELDKHSLRSIGKKNFLHSRKYSWEKCAYSTFAFIKELVKN